MLNIIIGITLLFISLKLIPSKKWIFQLPIYLNLQTTIFLFLLVTAKLIFTSGFQAIDYLLIVVSLGAILTQSLDILPFLKISSPTVPQALDNEQCDTSFTILISNVLFTNTNYTGITKIIKEKNADIVGLVEIDSKWVSALQEHISTERYPYQIILPRADGYGMYVFSKFKLEEKHIFRIYNETPGLYFVAHTASTELHCFLLHPKPPVYPEAETAQPKDKEFEEMGQFISNLEGDKKVIAFGDLNDVAWSKSTKDFIKRSGLRDPRVGRGIMPTFPAWAPYLGFPLDQIFVSQHFKIKDIQCLPSAGSDHFPVLVDLCVQKNSN